MLGPSALTPKLSRLGRASGQGRLERFVRRQRYAGSWSTATASAWDLAEDTVASKRRPGHLCIATEGDHVVPDCQRATDEPKACGVALTRRQLHLTEDNPDAGLATIT